MKQLPHIPKNQHVLVVIAHPDDELLMASFLKKLLNNGCKIRLIVLTRGEGLLTGVAGEELAEKRLQELGVSCAALGITDFAVWYIPDGRIHEVPEQELITRLRQEMQLFQAELVAGFNRDGWTRHTDHITAHTVTYEAARQSGLPLWAITLPMEFVAKIMPCLSARRKTMQCYNDSVAHPELASTFAVESDNSAIDAVIQAHSSQNLHMYGKLMEIMENKEYFVSY